MLANDTDPNGDALTITGVSNAVGGDGDRQRRRDGHLPAAGGLRGHRIVRLLDQRRPRRDRERRRDGGRPGAAEPAAGGECGCSDHAGGRAVTISVLANDSDPNGDPLTVTAVGSAVGGSAAINAGNTVTFSPAAGFSGAGVVHLLDQRRQGRDGERRRGRDRHLAAGGRQDGLG